MTLGIYHRNNVMQYKENIKQTFLRGDGICGTDDDTFCKKKKNIKIKCMHDTAVFVII